MRIPIWLQVLLVVDVLVIAATATTGWFAGETAGNVVEERLIQETAERTGDFLAGRNLPITDTLMEYLHQMHGVHFVVVQAGSDRRPLASSFQGPAREAFGRASLVAPRGRISLAGKKYLFDTHEVTVSTGRPVRRQRVRLYALVPHDEFQSARHLAHRRVIVVSAIVLAVATGMAILGGMTLSRPLARLSRRMQQTEGGLAGAPNEEVRSLPSPAIPHGPREVRQLAEAYDSLLARLARARADLARHERLAALGRLAASVVHELRNPLSGVRMNLRLLQDDRADRDDTDPASHCQTLETALREIDRMKLYLDELADLAAQPHGGSDGPPALPMRPGPVDLAEVVRSTVDTLAGRCRHVGVDVRLNLDDVPAVRGDANRLRQVLMNLTINAIEAMPAGGTVTVGLQVGQQGRVVCSVRDEGEGIATHVADKLYDPFVSTKSGSSGLGLYVSRRIIEAHQGSMSTENAMPGAVFRFELPVWRDEMKTSATGPHSKEPA